MVGTGKWSAIDNGYTYTFNRDGSFTSTKIFDCLNGTYTYDDKQLTLIYNCTNSTSSSVTFVENYKLDSGFLYLTPSYLMCDEGCDYKFKKTSN